MARNERTEDTDPTDRVAVARASAADDGPGTASGGAGSAPSAVGGRAAGAREVDGRFHGQDLEPAEDTVPEEEGDDGSGLSGVPGVGDLRGDAPGADLAGSSDPLRSFLDVAEGKAGRGSGRTDPGGQANANPASGRPSVADGAKPIGPDTLDEFEARNGVFIGPQPELRGLMDRAFMPTREKEEEFGPYAPDDDEAPAESDEDDETPEADPPDSDEVTGESDPPHDPPPGDPAPDTDEVTGDSDTPHGPPPSPGPDDEVAPLPADLQAQLDSDVARFRRQRGDSGDGATDPSEIDEEQVGSASPLPDRAAVGQNLFGQPDTDAATGGGGGTPNTGADSQGAGVITPGDDQAAAGGAQRDDDPFGDAAGTLEPAADAADDGASSSLLPPDTIADEVDDPAGALPGALDRPD